MGVAFSRADYELFFKGLFTNTRASVLIIDRRLHVVAANRNFLQKSRRSEEETIGARLEEVFPPVLLNFIGLVDKVRAALRDGSFFADGQMTYRAPGLPMRIYYYLLAPLTDATQLVPYVLLLMYDVTEEQRLSGEVLLAERHLASVVQAASDLVVSLDPEERIISWNPAAEAASKYSFKDVSHKPFHSLFSPENQEFVLHAVARLTKGGHPENLEADLITRDGRHVPVAWALSGMQSASDIATAVVGVGRDLTLRRQLEAQILQSAKMSSLGVMAGGIAHEIRNPLGICSAAAQLMMEFPEDTTLQLQCARRIYDNINRAALVIDNLLKFSRPPEEQHTAIDLNRIIEQALALVANEARNQHIRIDVESDGGLKPIMANGNLLQQVFTNLVLNAFHAMDGGGRLLVQIQQCGDAIEVRFQDSGHGIEEADLNRIFDPFYTTMPVGQGTGLGLPVSYSIIQQHGGRIHVESEVGKGSTFTVQLPVHPQ